MGRQKDHPKSICRETQSEVDGILTKRAAIVAEPLAGRLHVTYGPRPTQAAPQTVSLN